MSVYSELQDIMITSLLVLIIMNLSISGAYL